MAEKAEKKPDSAASAAPAGGEKKEHGKGGAGGGGGGLLTKTPVLLGGVMLIEAVVLFAGFKFLGGGAKHADAADVTAGESGDHPGHGSEAGKAKGPAGGAEKRNIEVPALVDFRAPNKVNGQSFIFDVSIFVVTKGENEEKVRKGIKENEALIKDRVGTIIRQSDPEKLGGKLEPGLETLRRHVKHQLEDILGEGMVDEVLVPRAILYPS